MYRIDTWSGESMVEHFSRSGRVSARLSGRGRAHWWPSMVRSASILSCSVIDVFMKAFGCVRRWELEENAIPSKAFHARPYCWNSGASTNLFQCRSRYECRCVSIDHCWLSLRQGPCPWDIRPVVWSLSINVPSRGGHCKTSFAAVQIRARVRNTT